MGHLNSAKHKANHGGYKSKPSKQSIKALMDLYAGVSIMPEPITPKMASTGNQLKLF